MVTFADNGVKPEKRATTDEVMKMTMLPGLVASQDRDARAQTLARGLLDYLERDAAIEEAERVARTRHVREHAGAMGDKTLTRAEAIRPTYHALICSGHTWR